MSWACICVNVKLHRSGFLLFNFLCSFCVLSSRSCWGCQITDQGLYQISLARCISNLTSISLWGMTGITDEGVVHLVCCSSYCALIVWSHIDTYYLRFKSSSVNWMRPWTSFNNFLYLTIPIRETQKNLLNLLD